MKKHRKSRFLTTFGVCKMSLFEHPSIKKTFNYRNLRDHYETFISLAIERFFRGFSGIYRQSPVKSPDIKTLE